MQKHGPNFVSGMPELSDTGVPTCTALSATYLMEIKGGRTRSDAPGALDRPYRCAGEIPELNRAGFVEDCLV